MPRRSSSSVSSTSGTSESNIVFFAAGGHSHDGSNSSLIDASKYSIFDFDQGFLRTNTERSARQDRNRILFEDTVREIFRTAGVELGENVISAQNIIAGTITSNEIAANTITTNELATDSIKSLNYSYTSGRYSDSGSFLDLLNGEFITPGLFLQANGDAYFSGTLEAAGGSLASFKISSTGLTTFGDTATGITDANESDEVGGSSIYTTTGYINIENYGDIFIGSSPNGGSYIGQHHKTNLTGEFLNIRQTTSNTYSTNTGVYSHFGRSGASGVTNYMAMALEVKPTSYANSLHNHSRVSSSDVQSEVEVLFSNSSVRYEAIVNADSNSSDFYLYNSSVLAFHATTTDGGYVQTGSTSGNYVRLRANGYVSGSPIIMSDDLTIQNSSPGIIFDDTTSNAYKWLIENNGNILRFYNEQNDDIYDLLVTFDSTGKITSDTIVTNSITSYGTITVTGNINPYTITLAQNPVGTTYGNGSSSTPTYMISQTAGDNDGWRIYGESTASNQGRLVLEVTDDQDESIIIRHKKTYSPFSATDHIFSPSGLSVSGSVSSSSVSVSGGSGSAGNSVALQVTGSSASLSLRSNGTTSNSGDAVQIRAGRTGDQSRGMAYFTQYDGSSPADINCYRIFYDGGSIGSSRTIKKDITNIFPAESSDAINLLKQLTVTSFKYINGEDNDIRYGLIAEDVYKVDKNLIIQMQDIPRYLKDSVHFVTMAAVKQLILKVEELEKLLISKQ